MRVVLDTNVIVSALISSQGAPGETLQAWERDRFDLVVSPATLDELGRVLHYPKIQKKYNLPTEHLDRFLRTISSQAILVNPTKELKVIKADPSDNRYLECAQEGDAAFIVTGDKHLLDLGEFEGTIILPPAGFLAVLELEGKQKP
jgi:putative PIN family toxin of toxin-antitoxin system